MGSGSKNKTTTQATTVSTPTTPAWFSGSYENLAGQAQGLMSRPSTDFTTPASALQNSAFARAQAGTGTPTAEGEQATRGLLGYTPQKLSDTDLAPYMNPYTGQVIDTSVRDLDNARQRTINGTNASTGRGAWNGSRQGVADSETNRGYLDSVSSLVSQLRAAGYNNAQQGAQYDIDNQNNNAVFKSQLAQQLASLGLAGAANTRADTQMQADQGQTERSIASENNPNVASLTQLQALAGILGQIPGGAFTGQTSNQSGTSTTSSNPGLLGTLGTLAQIAGVVTGNPFLVAGGAAGKKVGGG
jgi:hypothetical protein